MLLRTLSGRFLILTIIFVMLAEVLIFVPSIADFRRDYLMSRLERAQIAALAQIAADDMISPDLERELLQNADVFNIVLRRNEMRQLILSSPVPLPISETYDMRHPNIWTLIGDALSRLITPEDQTIRVVGEPVRSAGLLIEVTMQTGPLRMAMMDYGLRVLGLSLFISAITSAFLFVAVRWFIVAPIRSVIDQVQRYAEDPNDARRVIEPSAGVMELREVEDAIKSMQTHISSALKQRERLAQLGEAVAKVSHDLRNILTTSQLFADRMEISEDPIVKRAAPKLVNSISRAVNLCETTLAFGKAEEPPPQLNRVQLANIVDDVLESERLAARDADITFTDDVPDSLAIRADAEQLYRVLSNMLRNARQAIVAAGSPGKITVSAKESDHEWVITIADTGPGLPPKAQENLFQPFSGGTRKEGTGLGLAIASELIRGHGGQLELVQTGEDGTTFKIHLPKTVISAGTITN